MTMAFNIHKTCTQAELSVKKKTEKHALSHFVYSIIKVLLTKSAARTTFRQANFLLQP